MASVVGYGIAVIIIYISEINILRHSRRFFICAYKALLPAQYEWVPTGVWTITKPVPQNNLPSLSGNVADSAASGWFSDALQNSIKNKENSNVNK